MNPGQNVAVYRYNGRLFRIMPNGDINEIGAANKKVASQYPNLPRALRPGMKKALERHDRQRRKT